MTAPSPPHGQRASRRSYSTAARYGFVVALTSDRGEFLPTLGKDQDQAAFLGTLATLPRARVYAARRGIASATDAAFLSRFQHLAQCTSVWVVEE